MISLSDRVSPGSLGVHKISTPMMFSPSSVNASEASVCRMVLMLPTELADVFSASLLPLTATIIDTTASVDAPCTMLLLLLRGEVFSFSNLDLSEMAIRWKLGSALLAPLKDSPSKDAEVQSSLFRRSDSDASDNKLEIWLRPLIFPLRLDRSAKVCMMLPFFAQSALMET